MSEGETERVFLGYTRPALRPAAEWLASRFRDRNEADLGDVFVCVQGKRAGWHLLALLVDVCAERGVVLVPPSIGTPLDLLDEVFPSDAPEAGTARRMLAWCRVIAGADVATRRALAPGRDGTITGLRERLTLAEVLEETRRELSGHAMTIADAAVALGEPGKDTPDLERWRAGAALERGFEEELGVQGVIDGAGARVRAVRGGGSAAKRRPTVVLVATPELPRLARLALAAHRPAAALVIAAERDAASFDELGTVKAESFAVTDLRTEQVRIAASPAGQAREVERVLRGLAPGTPADSVLIGVPDSEVVPAVRACLEPLGVRVRDAGGREAARAAPARFLEAVRAIHETGSTRELATLVRHPDVFAWVTERIGGEGGAAGGAWLRELDAALAERPARRLSNDWRDSGVTHDGACVPMTRCLSGLLGPLAPGAGAEPARTISEWAGAVRGCLARLYADSPVGDEGSESDISYRACESIAASLVELEECDRGGRAPAVTAAEAIGLIMRLCESDRIPSPAEPDAVEMVGWLEVAFDDAPVCVVTGLNEGSVPRGTGGGTLLSGGTRRALGLPGSEGALSRDAYLLNVVLRCHERVVVIAGRRSASGDPLKPSRLLFSCGDEELARRVRLWTAEDDKAGASPVTSAGAAIKSAFTPMPRAPFAPITSMSVTSFKLYLASPYGFFLQRVLRLGEVGEPEPELEARAVGDLFHATMKRFAESPARDAAALDDIRGAMLECFEDELRGGFGPAPQGIVRVQAAQLRERIKGVAEMQAQRRDAGWSIAHAEWQPSSPVVLRGPGGEMTLTGKIDRIDTRDGGREVAILDYKTGESAKAPEKTHLRAGAWVDLQLPLYLHLAAELWPEGSPRPTISLGYINVPVRPGRAEVVTAKWDDAALKDADRTAHEVVANVVAGRFFEMGDSPPDVGAMGRLCGEGLILHGDAEGGEDGEDAERGGSGE